MYQFDSYLTDTKDALRDNELRLHWLHPVLVWLLNLSQLTDLSSRPGMGGFISTGGLNYPQQRIYPVIKYTSSTIFAVAGTSIVNLLALFPSPVHMQPL
ncbi:hypothetical protein PF004_g7304 [Phytophthora fragariae]|uniref:Uncharacterized protein n=1 Tax=Phytophthora fragariae TaxID=53985 RepID=A0A6G0PAI7_9STRA|nr:hypothetical protein PF004_g7304 [Phytophthora fragariae]